ncbi:hypothetical protein [Georgenia subflava]|uniref:Uncharacterized protein n=1 Tax=Georgenia subflava TaxID=1622177 RepID=A0A6N7ELI2_9MICO|nr:hypothetical protein [Georgenia subflava]MPV36996.1 hypothetical protein [Georgenia subflava]
MLAAAVVGGLLIVRQGSAPFATDPTAAPVLAASIVLAGAIVTAAVTLTGLLLRQTIDARTARLADEAAARAEREHQRLRMQTAMETLKLLATSSGSPASAEQVSAALIVLSRLHETELALDLAAELWPKGQVTPSAAVSLCDDAIRSKTPALQRAAAVLLFNNRDRLTQESGQVQWPSSLLTWPDGLDEEARNRIRLLLTEWLAKRPPSTSTDFRSSLLREP